MAAATTAESENCPNCGEFIGAPGGAHGRTNETMHSHRECPTCGRLLIWFKEGVLATGWRIDEDEERRRELRSED
jgi:predicted RNA-binding Zn-ribbon protein involved in translation (DUF1610 family)